MFALAGRSSANTMTPSLRRIFTPTIGHWSTRVRTADSIRRSSEPLIGTRNESSFGVIWKRTIESATNRACRVASCSCRFTKSREMYWDRPTPVATNRTKLASANGRTSRGVVRVKIDSDLRIEYRFGNFRS